MASEGRLIEAATRLSLRRGTGGRRSWTSPRLRGVAPRTVYVRFGTKAAMFMQVMGVAVVGNTEPVDPAHRDWVRRALTAPTFAERLNAQSDEIATLFGRIAPLMTVAHEAELDDESVAAAAQAARQDTTAQLAASWRQAFAISCCTRMSTGNG